MNDVIQKIYDIGIVPVIAIDDADKAVPLENPLRRAHHARRGGHQAHRGRST